MKIGVDFDRVLFRTEEFIEFLEEEIPGFTEKYPEEGVYSAREHAKKLGIDTEQILHTLGRADEFLYDDVDFLEKLKPEHELVLVSRGEPSFQGKKIVESGISELFDAVVVIEEGAKDRIDIDFLIDDREEEHDRTGIPGLVFDRNKHSAEDIVSRVKKIEARSSI